MLKIHRILFLTSLLAGMTILLASCGSSKDQVNTLAYFQTLKDSTGTLPEGTTFSQGQTIQSDDELVITISSSNPSASAIYNAPLTSSAQRGEVLAQAQPKLLTYIVGADGNISIPKIGVLHVAGLTTDEIAAIIKEKVAETVKDPYVRVELLNWTVDVMGEVKTPRRIVTGKQKMTVLDALAEANDLTEFAKRDGVIVIREVDGKKTYTRLNLQDSKLFSSPCYYLRQGDVVYVEPNSIRIDNSKYNQNNAFKLSVISTIVSAASVIASLVIALTVK